MLAVIMAGGKGTRVASIAANTPKPMLPLAGKPVLAHQIEALARQGHTQITLVTGHLGGVIKEYFGDGARFGVSITYLEEETPLGTAGALFRWKEALDDTFLLLCGDVFFDLDIERFIRFHYAANALATLAAHPSGHPFDSAILETDDSGKLSRWLAKEDPRTYYKNLVNAGLHIITKELLSRVYPAGGAVDLDRDVLKPHISSGRIFAYNTPEYIKDMGTPERFFQVEADIQNSVPARRSLSRRQRALFLDRDGTINQLRAKEAEAEKRPANDTAHGFVLSPEELVLIPGAADAIRLINDSGWLAIVITNQPVIARGLCAVDTLDTIHKKLETELGKNGAYINDLYYCPHHPHKGFEGEVERLKIECECRKPKPGMILRAAGKYPVDLSESWMIGDSFRDVEAGKAAGCKTAYIDYDGRDTGADITVKSLYEAVTIILGTRPACA